MQKSLQILFWLVLVGWTTSATAFVPSIVETLSQSSSSRATAASVSLLLHPKQAAELEACAFECYSLESSKVAQRQRGMNDDRRSNAMMSTMMTNGSSPNTVMMNNKRTSAAARRGGGPVAWCRRVISGSAVNRRHPA